MKVSRIVAAVCFGLLLLPLVFTQAQQDGKKPKEPTLLEKSKEISKEITAKAQQSRPVKEIVEAMSALEEIEADLHRVGKGRFKSLMNHRDPAVRKQTIQTMVEMCRVADIPETVTLLTKALGHREVEVREAALYGVARLVPHVKDAMPNVLKALNDKDPRVRRAAYHVISRSLRFDKELISYVLAAVDDPDEGDPKQPLVNPVTRRAFNDLIYLNTAAKEAAPKLIKIYQSKEKSEFHRERALAALCHVAPEEKMILELSRKWLQDPDTKIVMKGAGFAGALGVHGKDAVPDLIAATKRKPLADALEEQSFKMALMQGFRGIGPAAKDALPTLEALAQTQDATLRHHVLVAIKAVKGGGEIGEIGDALRN